MKCNRSYKICTFENIGKHGVGEGGGVDGKGNFVFPPIPGIYVLDGHNQESAQKILRTQQGGLYH